MIDIQNLLQCGMLLLLLNKNLHLLRHIICRPKGVFILSVTIIKKIKILQNSEVELTRDLCEDIAKKTKSTFVDSIGRVIILFKPNSKEGKLAKEFKEFKDKAKKGKK